ncbi:Uncharacterised protein [Mycobacteroides abscessus subsp. bolletii]|uniref:hypothetical protein n=1 Tax=Mycobacteroides abscessus TaxID=36809 RepID=UPI00092880AF|nr:hypothetical protein [Mycobacteroides abscessus]SHQ51700.1 Uncharacterised protein [Mycobacteroides abscessus subsp. abscessus]SKQ82268.1 Uncharacterised protein [Mycobacteroides abscessus subsp. massiliense]SKU93949.1 Uncharacterised protein [Mycobacteroides abscessus subsp. bolletii]SLC50602.1 Uncharacterised protein [Mycobacteroides abscessus subsp. massiliense]
MNTADTRAPVPPSAVLAAVADLRDRINDLHVMHECDENCGSDCDLRDESPAAYRAHDEHNFDVREQIEQCASGLLDALEEWLGPVLAEASSPCTKTEGSGLLVVPAIGESGEGVEYCDECNQLIDGFGPSWQHAVSCSLYQDNLCDPGGTTS